MVEQPNRVWRQPMDNGQPCGLQAIRHRTLCSTLYTDLPYHQCWRYDNRQLQQWSIGFRRT